ncbi:MAG: hypothetical protein Q7I97_04905 [Thermovirgaceae bacterium]|nr:hypothetical protein [Thermovirgaceae bacterium]
MMLVMASCDADAIPKIHQIPVAEMLSRTEGPKTIVSFSCSHDFSEKRTALAEALYDWLES